jgi:hypothetical protein
VTTAARIDRRNRRRFTLLALLLIALGVLGLVLAADLLQVQQPSELYRRVAEPAGSQPWIVPTVLILLGLLLAYLGLRALRKQFATPTTRLAELTLARGERGRTTVEVDAYSRALTRDLERLEVVHSASARVVGAGTGALPHVRVRATYDEGVPVAEVRAAMEPAYQRLASTMGVEAVERDLHLKPASSRLPRVR